MEDGRDNTGVSVSGRAADDVIPGRVRSAFPGLAEADGCDRAIVKAQLGKPYQGEIFVTSRCPHGAPAVVLTLPIEGSGGPVPPMLWLTCPRATAAAGRLESSGCAAGFGGRLEGDDSLAGQFVAQEERFAALQEELARSVGGEHLAARLADRGAASGPIGAVKCLHAHLAYHLSLRGGAVEREGPGSVLGEWCEEMLEEEGGVWCERPPAPCVA